MTTNMEGEKGEIKEGIKVGMKEGMKQTGGEK